MYSAVEAQSQYAGTCLLRGAVKITFGAAAGAKSEATNWDPELEDSTLSASFEMSSTCH